MTTAPTLSSNAAVLRDSDVRHVARDFSGTIASVSALTDGGSIQNFVLGAQWQDDCME